MANRSMRSGRHRLKAWCVRAGNRVIYCVCRSQKDPQPAVSPVPVFWVAKSRAGNIIGIMSSAKWD